MELRIRIVHPVLVVLHSCRGKLLFSCSILMHVPFCHQCIKCGERCAEKEFCFHISCASKRKTNLGCINLCHFFNADNEYALVLTG